MQMWSIHNHVEKHLFPRHRFKIYYNRISTWRKEHKAGIYLFRIPPHVQSNLVPSSHTVVILKKKKYNFLSKTGLNFIFWTVMSFILLPKCRFCLRKEKIWVATALACDTCSTFHLNNFFSLKRTDFFAALYSLIYNFELYLCYRFKI